MSFPLLPQTLLLVRLQQFLLTQSARGGTRFQMVRTVFLLVLFNVVAAMVMLLVSLSGSELIEDSS